MTGDWSPLYKSEVALRPAARAAKTYATDAPVPMSNMVVPSPQRSDSSPIAGR